VRLKPIGLALIALSTGAPAVPTRACDSASCSLPTRGANVLVPKKQFRLDLSFGYSDQGLLLRGSQEVDTVYRPRVFLERETIIPGFHRDIDSHDRVEQANMAYGLSERVNLVASAPLAIWHAHTVAHGAVEQEYGTVGFGDALVGARFSLRPRGLVAGFSLNRSYWSE
jgi:hypothetical protein